MLLAESRKATIKSWNYTTFAHIISSVAALELFGYNDLIEWSEQQQ